jgi:hypothetical protein
MPAKPFRAGAATSNVTPPLGVSINGGMQDRTAEHVHDELHARCLVLDDGNEQLAIAVVDNCAIPGHLHDAAKELVQGFTGLPIDRILISATHAHSCPTVVGVFQSEPDDEYCDFLARRIADGIRRAINNLAPAKVGWGVGREPNQVFNRRWKMKPGAIPANPFGVVDNVLMNPGAANPNLVEPSGPIDPDIGILAVTTAAGQPLALLANYSLHYVGGVPGTTISADYFGVFAHRLKQLLHANESDPPFVGMMSNGTSGNINNINFRAPATKHGSYEQMRTVAYAVADEVYRVYQGIKFQDTAKLDMREARINLGVRLPRPDEVARAKFILSQGEGVMLKSREEIYARETVLLSEWPGTVETSVQAVRIGDLGITTLPCEVFVETGLAIKEASPFKPTFTISLANSYNGYLPTVEHHKLGGYETWRARSSYLEVDAEPKLRKRALELLKQLA